LRDLRLTATDRLLQDAAEDPRIGAYGSLWRGLQIVSI
jgi:hypothetical protein